MAFLVIMFLLVLFAVMYLRKKSQELQLKTAAEGDVDDYLSVAAHLEDFGAGGSGGDEYLTISQHNGGGGGGGVDDHAVDEYNFDSDSDLDC